MTELYIIGGALAFGGLLLWALVKASEAKAVAQERSAQARDTLDAVKRANEAAADAGGMSADSRRKRLSEWSRD